MGKRRQDEPGLLFARIYFDLAHPAGFSSVARLAKASKTKRLAAQQFLRAQDAYTLFKPVRWKFPRRKTLSRGLHHQHQMDIVDLQNLKTYNDNHKYLLTIIDVFSRQAWAYCLKSKTGQEVAAVLEQHYRHHPTPRFLQTDSGKEFYNAQVGELLRKLNIHHFSVYSEPKASLVERFHRTILARLHRYFSKNNTYRYLEALPQLLHAYNNATHRSIGMAPVLVTKKNEKKVWMRLYAGQFPTSSPKYTFRIGDTVRIAQRPFVFAKGYRSRWTREYFTVAYRQNTCPVTYMLRDEHGNLVQGSFYEQQMQVIERPSRDEAYPIDVLRTRKSGRRGAKEYLVHYRGWPSSFDEWINAAQLKSM